MTQILVFGASSTYGCWDIEGGWVQRLRKFLDQKVIDSDYEEYFITYNLGIDGDTAEGVFKRFESESKIRMWPDEETVFIISVGGNDSIFVHKTKKTKFSTDQYKENLVKIITLAKKYSDKIIFRGQTPIDEEKVDPIPWLKDHSYKTEHVKEFDKITEIVAKENGLPFIDVYKGLEKSDYKKLLVDGVHPNSKGHEKIFEIVKDFLIKERIL